MPAKPSWLLEVPFILARVRELAVPFLDRASIENLFGIGRRRAHALMASFGGYQVGKTFLIDRAQLVSALESTTAGQDFLIEHRRKTRLSEELDRTRTELRGRKIPVAAAPDVRDRRVGDLPPGIRLKPGELRIEFHGTEDLLRHLYELSQAILNDWGKFQRLIEE